MRLRRLAFSLLAACVGVAAAHVLTAPSAVAQDGGKKAPPKAPAKPAPPPPKPRLELVDIPAGRFTMGDAENKDKAGEVTVAAFRMDRTEVTVAAYAACVANGKCTPADTGYSCNAEVAGRENHPINCVDWSQATAYCEWLGLRLPTEEEWEYAARGTDGRVYPWGNAEPSNQLCWNGEGNDLGKRNRSSTCAVGSYPAGRSPFGLDDMSGNVWEWTVTADGAQRVNRGGSWSNDDPSRVRSADRHRNDPTARHDHLGFRCAGSPLP